MGHIYTTGDTHGDFRRFSFRNFKRGKELTKKDFMIINGDFGGIWYFKDHHKHPGEIRQLEWLNNKPWTTLFVDGNHENFTLLKEFPEVPFHGGVAGKISDSIYHLKRGEIYTLNGLKFFCIGGASSIDKLQRVDGVSWWPEELLSYAEEANISKNLDRCQNTVDYIITHTAPTSIIKERLLPYIKMITGNDYYMEDPVSRVLDQVYKTVDFKRWFCGHMHCDIEFDDITFTYNKIHKIK